MCVESYFGGLSTGGLGKSMQLHKILTDRNLPPIYTKIVTHPGYLCRYKPLLLST